MPLTSFDLDRLVRLGTPAKAIVAIVKLWERDYPASAQPSATVSAPVRTDKKEDRRSKDRERKRLKRLEARTRVADNCGQIADISGKSPAPLSSLPSLTLFQEDFEEEKKDLTRAREKLFSAIWPEYPRRKGNNPRKTALVRYLSALAKGVSAEVIAEGVRRYRAHCEEEGNIGTPYIQRMDVWLNQEGWTNDYGTGQTRHKPNSIAGRFEKIKSAIADRERELAGHEGGDGGGGDYIDHIP